MFARFTELHIVGKKEEFLNTIRNQVLPILRKQPGFLEILPFVADNRPEKVVVISIWDSKANAEKHESETYPRVLEILKAIATPTTVGKYQVETSLCAHFAELLVA